VAAGTFLFGCGQLGPPTPDASSADATVDVGVQFGEAGVSDAGIDAPPDGSVACGSGDVWCDPVTQYCSVTGHGSGFCVLLPSQCLDDRTCECLADAGVLGTCEILDGGLVCLGCGVIAP
jgi:hypothetical protein